MGKFLGVDKDVIKYAIIGGILCVAGSEIYAAAKRRTIVKNR